MFVAPLDGVLTFGFYHELSVPSLNKQISRDALQVLKVASSSYCSMR
jgi:hypothetical protein